MMNATNLLQLRQKPHRPSTKQQGNSPLTTIRGQILSRVGARRKYDRNKKMVTAHSLYSSGKLLIAKQQHKPAINCSPVIVMKGKMYRHDKVKNFITLRSGTFETSERTIELPHLFKSETEKDGEIRQLPKISSLGTLVGYKCGVDKYRTYYSKSIKWLLSPTLNSTLDLNSSKCRPNVLSPRFQLTNFKPLS